MHMYFVNDLYNDTCAKAGSMTDIAYWWHRKVGRDFFQLNVTGKDTHTAMEKDGSWLHIQENGRSYVISAGTRCWMRTGGPSIFAPGPNLFGNGLRPIRLATGPAGSRAIITASLVPLCGGAPTGPP